MIDTPQTPIPDHSEHWMKARRGKITASEVHILMAGTYREIERYKKRLVNDLLGLSLHKENVILRGNREESKAQAVYEMRSGFHVKQSGFYIHPKILFFGASPDGEIDGDGLLEMKNPTDPQVHLMNFARGMDEKHNWQIQSQIACTDRLWADFVSYDSRQVLGLDYYCQRVNRDQKMIDDIIHTVTETYAEILQLL